MLAPFRQSLAKSSGNVAASTATATLTHSGSPAQRLWLTGFIVTGAGSTAGAAVNVTVTGCIGGTQTYVFTGPVGALVPSQPLVVQFEDPISAVDENTDIVVSMPSLGSGNTNACIVVTGFYA